MVRTNDILMSLQTLCRHLVSTTGLVFGGYIARWMLSYLASCYYLRMGLQLVCRSPHGPVKTGNCVLCQREIRYLVESIVTVSVYGVHVCVCGWWGGGENGLGF